MSGLAPLSYFHISPSFSPRITTLISEHVQLPSALTGGRPLAVSQLWQLYVNIALVTD